VTDRPLITYIRVSTSQQGRSGLGIEAQRQALSQFALAEGFEVAREFVEVETGKGRGRVGPQAPAQGRIGRRKETTLPRSRREAGPP